MSIIVMGSLKKLSGERLSTKTRSYIISDVSSGFNAAHECLTSIDMFNADRFGSMNSKLHYNDSHTDRNHEDIYITETTSLWMSMVPIALSLADVE